MTDSPEDIARGIVRKHVFHFFEPGEQHPHEMEPRLYEAIAAAIKAERERCAEIAENWMGSAALVRAMSRSPNMGEAPLKVVRGEATFIAAAIRNPAPPSGETAKGDDNG